MEHNTSFSGSKSSCSVLYVILPSESQQIKNKWEGNSIVEYAWEKFYERDFIATLPSAASAIAKSLTPVTTCEIL